MSVHAIGNGKVCAYIDGTNIQQLFGPGYSSPVAAAVRCTADAFCRTDREAIGIWCSVGERAELRDYADPALPVFYREVNASSPLSFAVRAENTDSLFVIPDIMGVPGVMSVTYEGTVMYPYENIDGACHGYVSGKRRYFAIGTLGDAYIEITDRLSAALTVAQGTLVFAFADTPEQLFELLKNAEPRDALHRCRAASEALSHRLRSSLTEGQLRFAHAAENVYDAILAQRAESGGVLAGTNFHLCYIRDNYGVFRGLLAMGDGKNAVSLVDYYIDVYERFGRVQNAQGPSEPAFHIHENEAVEVTGYLVDMVVRAYLHSHDKTLLCRARGLLSHCIRSQHGQLHRGLLPFNGDETYIAGGILPRTAINDASMEATALYHAALKGVLTVRRDVPDYLDELDFIEEDMREIEVAFLPAFLKDRGLVCNMPDSSRPEPPCRTGVRMCGHGFGLSFRNSHGDYVCPDCITHGLQPLADTCGRVYSIPSALLMPMFVGTDLIPRELAVSTARCMLGELQNKARITGYDYGLLLYILRDDPETSIDDIVSGMLGQRDENGVWSEFYTHGSSDGTPCRPWESGINMAALLELMK